MKNADTPIIPAPYTNQDGTIQHDVYLGLTKREYFAAMAMQGFIVNRHAQDSEDKVKVAMWAISLADEVLNQLETP